MKINFAEVRTSPEYTSAIIRFAFWILASLFIGIAMYTGYYELQLELYLYFCIIFFIYSVVVFISILYVPRVKYRPYVTIPLDVGAIFLSMYLTDGGPLSPFFLLYPWYYLSYSVRYGRAPLMMAAVVGLLSFSLLLYITDSWYSHKYDVVAYVVFLIIMPFYLDMLLRQVSKAREVADKANIAKSEFLAAMSHEIRTPMSGIVGVSSLLVKSDLNPDQKEYVVALQESANALNALIDDVLDLSKIEAGKYKLENNEFNISKTLFGVAQMFTANANDKGLELFYSYDPALPEMVFGDATRLRQVVINLLSNAVKFTKKGKVKLKVSLLEKQDINGEGEATIKIEVIDTGSGLTKEQRDRIFEPFYQANENTSRAHSGTGLGTTISANIVKLMDGQIGVNSELDKGSQFWFIVRLPCAGKRAVYPTPLDHKPVVIFESSPTNREILTEYLKAYAWTAAIFDDENEFIDYMGKQERECIVLISELSCQSFCSEFAARIHAATKSEINHKIILLLKLASLHALSDEQRVNFSQLVSMPLSPQKLFDSIMSVGGYASTGNENEHTESSVSRFLSVLIAEDSAINAKVIQAFLSQDNHRVVHVEDGAQAVKALSEGGIDLVLMDMRMPVMGGIEATQKWRETEQQGQHIPIIALTANATTEDKNNCLAAGMDDFLSKPVSQEQLREVLKRYNV